ncbi:hypothetical protein [Parafannyhessea sp. LCP21S3_E6]|uniref:hypothetical protein n=1 Tax=unclassified Parafannyhessea TaxID=2847323 RepID=UPI003F962435
MAEEAKTADEKSLELLVAQLGGSHRRGRQEASRIVAAIAKTSPDAVLPYADDLVDALDRPEAQTRWQVLEALTALSAVDAQAASAALDGAEASLFDEDSPIVRLAAFKFLAALGARSKRLSASVWPLLDEAVQCYHGDPEYRDMLVALAEFVRGDVSDEVRAALVARVSFDAKNGRDYVKTMSQEIIDAAKE